MIVVIVVVIVIPGGVRACYPRPTTSRDPGSDTTREKNDLKPRRLDQSKVDAKNAFQIADPDDPQVIQAIQTAKSSQKPKTQSGIDGVSILDNMKKFFRGTTT